MNNNINDVTREKCTGCGACYNKCPVNAIEMKADGEGFLYPNIINERCIKCGLCYHFCPVIRQPEMPPYPTLYYAVMADSELRKVSSSGGIMTLLAETVLDQGGYVCGAAWTEGYNSVEHVLINQKKELFRIRKSKYLQSDMNDMYVKIEEKLKDQKIVIFTGCPCQVAGMRNYFGNKYSNLFLVDIVCHGVPSPLSWQKYLEEKREIGKIETVDFRNKDRGWGTPLFITYENGYSTYENCNENLFYRSFLGGLTTRPSCSTCKFANIDRIGDITLGDFWGVNSIGGDLDDHKGTGLVLINSRGGAELFSKIVLKVWKFQKVTKKQVIEIAKRRNGQLLAPKSMHAAHYRFFRLLKKMNYSKAFDYAVNWKYDIGILGWWANLNYGGTLTYYALYSVLEKMGYEVMMIEAPRDDGKEPRQDTVPRRFARKHYKISKVYTHGGLPTLNDHCKAFISGSDQLWNPDLSKYSDPAYFMSFANDNRIKLSYASSFGNSTTAGKEFIDKYSPMMKRFQGISVREDYAVDICRNLFGVEAVQVCDPVFLCTKNTYEELLSQATEKFPENFILNFLLDPNREKRNLIRHISEKLKLQNVNFTDLQFVDQKVKEFNLGKTYPNSDVENLIKAYAEARYVITDSFHGTCMAIIFNKPFICIVNRQRGEKRFESLMRWLHLESCFIYDISNLEEMSFSCIDYELTNRLIKNTRDDSLKWLKEKLSDIGKIV